jgi:hypothetical protein
MVSVLLTVSAKMPILGDQHIPAELNTKADVISRKSHLQLSLQHIMEVSDEMRGADVVHLDMDDLVALSDPRRRVETEADFGGFWVEARHALQH